MAVQHHLSDSGADLDQEVDGADGPPWHERVAPVVVAGGFSPDLAEEAVRLARTEALGMRDLRMLLLVSGDHQGWHTARRAAFELVRRQPELAQQVLQMHVQIEAWPKLEYQEAAVQGPLGHPVHEAAVRIGPPAREVTGPAVRASARKDARRQASVALLAQMAGAGRHRTGADTTGRLAPAVMGMEAFEAHLEDRLNDHHGPGTGLEAEILRRAEDDRLRRRDMHRLLFRARGSGWEPVRRVVLHQAASLSGLAAALLHMEAGEPSGTAEFSFTESIDEGGRHEVTARWESGPGAAEAIEAPPRCAYHRKTARHYAAVALLALVCGLPEPDQRVPDKEAPDPAGAGTRPRIKPPEAGQDPVARLNKYTQLAAISKPQAQFTDDGQQKTRCTYTCRHLASGRGVSARGSGPSKDTARQEAARTLLTRLHTLDSGWHETTGTQDPQTGNGAPALPAPRRPDPMPSATAPDASPYPGTQPARETVSGLLASGCALAFVPPTPGRAAGMFFYRPDHQPEHSAEQAACGPTADFTFTVLSGEHRTHGIPATAATTAGRLVPVGDTLAPLLSDPSSPSASVWAHAARLALEMVAKRLVYPSVTVDGLDQWRAGPLPDTASQTLDTMAEALPDQARTVADDGRLPPARETVEEFVHAVADTMLRSPAAAMFGPGPFTRTAPEPLGPADDAVREWTDTVEDRAAGGPPPPLVLEVTAPGTRPSGEALTARLLLGDGEQHAVAAHVWSGDADLARWPLHVIRPRVMRHLRHLARNYPVLAPLTGPQGRLVLSDNVLRQLMEHESAWTEAGLTVRWPGQMRTALKTHAVIGPHHSHAPRFTLHALLDFRWQAALGDDALSDDEMDALAEAARPLVRVRGQWTLLDPLTRERLHHRHLGQLSGTQALTAALTGSITVNGDNVACHAAGPLADIITALRQGESAPPVPTPPGLRGQLRSYQQRALAWLSHTGRLGFGALLADDMGLGKTLAAIAYILHRQKHHSDDPAAPAGPTLVVCPSSLVVNWTRELARFAPGADTVTYLGSSRSLDGLTPGTIVITTYGVLRRDHATLAARTWDLVVADEAQHVKNPASQTARQLRTVPSAMRLALTGTPVENNLSELWALLDWCCPGLFGTLTSFRAHYAAAAERDPTGPAAQQLALLTAPFVLRRRKTDPGIAPGLPPKIHRRRIVRLTGEQTALYEALVRETMDQVRASHGIARSGLVFKLLTALKQIANHPAHYLREPTPTPHQVHQFANRSAKLQALDDILAQLAERQEATLIFTSYVAMGRLLHAHLTHTGHHPLFLHGGLTPSRRQQVIDTFQNNHDHRALLLSLKTGGTGLNLVRASHVVHYDRSWNAAVEDQASDRAHRIGQQQTVTVHQLIAQGTVEDRIDQLLEHKRALSDAVLTTGDAALSQLTDSELAALVRLETHP
ncbi:SNF2-related protein [Streptomyces sp. NPDC002476]|uniref:DEAD/DEAH box helicase n=1 Tax=Streptomyces sp. NPDC002476 TaxID=3364648 RepID=UPI0036B67D8B